MMGIGSTGKDDSRFYRTTAPVQTITYARYEKEVQKQCHAPSGGARSVVLIYKTNDKTKLLLRALRERSRLSVQQSL